MTQPTEPLLTADQVAKMLNVRRTTVYEWARTDYIPHIHLGTGKKRPLVRFSRSKVEEWIRLRETGGRSKRVPDLS